MQDGSFRFLKYENLQNEAFGSLADIESTFQRNT
jgi:hypothetical protein